MAVGSLEKIISEMKDGVYDFTKDGECSRCGNCCSDFLPVSDKEIEKIKKYIIKNKIIEQKHLPPTAEPLMYFTCPFFNSNYKKCVIYSVRPAICQDFQCDKPRKEIELNKELFHDKYCAVSMRETFFKEAK